MPAGAAQVMFKYMWQQAAERRDVKGQPPPHLPVGG